MSGNASLPSGRRTVPSGRVTVLSGGVGGAKLALGFYKVLEADRLTVIANSGDDLELFNLRICPDSDIIIYTLAGQVNEQAGWGIRDDTFRALQRAASLGATDWFNLGDADIGLHFFRTELLGQGVGLAEITRRIVKALGVGCTVLPMCEALVTTRLETDRGNLHLQEYLVKHRAEPVVREISFDGISGARPAPGIEEAIKTSGLVVIAPSNPLISIGPILAVPGLEEMMRGSGALKVAVSPIVGGESLKGPSDKMLAELGHEVSAVGVARLYRHVIDVFVVDEQDAARLPEIEALGLRCVVADTVMRDLSAKESLARTLLQLNDAR